MVKAAGVIVTTTPESTEVKPVKPVEPVEPVEPVKPVELVKHVEPFESVSNLKNRAALISKDQSNKINSFVNKTRQLELGIAQAVWVYPDARKTPSL